jgi:hypothetical protein
MLRVKWCTKKIERNKLSLLKMTPEEKAIIEEKLKEVAEILYKNTPEQELDTVEIALTTTTIDPH